eukprot:4258132-Pyramimonas_sp.AAC.1
MTVAVAGGAAPGCWRLPTVPQGARGQTPSVSIGCVRWVASGWGLARLRGRASLDRCLAACLRVVGGAARWPCIRSLPGRGPALNRKDNRRGRPAFG